MTWTVDSGDVTTFAYRLNGRQITILLALANTTIGGTADTQLNVLLPGGFSSAKTARGPCVVFLASGGMALGRVQVTTTSTQILLSLGGTNWPLGNTTLEGMFVAEVS